MIFVLKITLEKILVGVGVKVFFAKLHFLEGQLDTAMNRSKIIA